MGAVVKESLKRKMTDPNLEVITIDPMYDLTLIVGTPKHPKGQKAFQINKGSFRNVSAVWSKMLNGNWSESTQSEIEFPEDSCDAFLIVLRIAHFQMSKLPEQLSMEELVDLATLTDKYSLEDAVRVGPKMKKWMVPHRRVYKLWPANKNLQDYAIATYVFKLQNDFKYLVTCLAIEATVSDVGNYYYTDEKEDAVNLRSNLPDYVLTEIKRIRSEILLAWIADCTAALNEAIEAPSSSCTIQLCSAAKLGIIVKGLQAAGFYPSPSSTNIMRGNVVDYWESIKSIGNSHKTYRGTSRGSSCSYTRCFGDFGIKMTAKAIVENLTHKDVCGLWKLDED